MDDSDETSKLSVKRTRKQTKCSDGTSKLPAKWTPSKQRNFSDDTEQISKLPAKRTRKETKCDDSE